jgi:hypothetical protein
MAEEKPKQGRSIPIKVTDDIVGGVYSNHMMVSHTREEFFLDFFSMLPEAGKLSARVIASPGHVKRIARALTENITKYESRFGPITEAPAPPSQSIH